MTVRMAHFSDLHLSRFPSWRELTSKRALGGLNWLCHRWLRHSPRRLTVAVKEVLRRHPDVVLCTGDLGQLGLVREVNAAAALLEPLHRAGIPILFTTGNHDRYGPDSESGQTWRLLVDHFRLGIEIDADGIAEWRGIQFLLFDQGRPTPLFNAWGEMMRPTLARLAERLAGLAAPELTRVAAGHFPLCASGRVALPVPKGLKGADILLTMLRENQVSAYCCGHLHHAFVCELFPGGMQYCGGSVTGSGGVRFLVADRVGVREDGSA